ncbi:Protein CBG11492 [Caenorhabditis briggsae]|nr:Protein CBG11492 [Caenorhabditis briggsae]CAP30476.2 Protein CBG11492 [Caenorhabditis briggsae]
MDMSHVLVIAPLVVFALFFLTVLVLRSFFLMSREEQRRDRIRRGGPVSSMSSNDTGIEISCTNNLNSNNRNNVRSNNNSNNNPNPPSYYAEVMATNSSALYPVYVPPYAAPLMSLRDPRQFQGLPGLAAPPPYPPPPSYHQISSFPELPSAPHAVINVAQQPRITKTRLEVTPVE